MKKIIILSFIIFCSCASKKNTSKLKTISNNHFEITYPKSWVKFGAMGYVYLTPKTLRKANPEDELNNISVSRNVLNVEKFIGLENTLKEHANTLRRNESNKESKIIKMEENSKFVYKIESLVEYKSEKNKYKRLEFFYIKNNRLDFIRFQMKEHYFGMYYNDALKIINSFVPK